MCICILICIRIRNEHLHSAAKTCSATSQESASDLNLNVPHETKTRQKITTLPRYIDCISLETLTSTKLGEPSGSSHIRIVSGHRYAGPNIAISYGIHVVRRCWVVEAGVFPVPTLLNVQIFHFFAMFSLLPYASWNVHIWPHTWPWCMYNHDKLDV